MVLGVPNNRLTSMLAQKILSFSYNMHSFFELICSTTLWRGGRGKAERAKGRAGSETSGETVGK